MLAFRETEEFQRGRRGELIVSFALRSLGYFIVPSYDYGGEDGDKAPRMHGPGRKALIIPDMDASRDGKRRWFEIKTKKAADFTRITQRLEHGMDLRHYDNYQNVQLVSGTEVSVVVYEQEDGEILGITLNHIAKVGRRYPNFNKGRGGMFWPRSSMTIMGWVDKAPDDVINIELRSKFRTGDITHGRIERHEDLRFRLKFRDEEPS